MDGSRNGRCNSIVLGGATMEIEVGGVGIAVAP